MEILLHPKSIKCSNPPEMREIKSQFLSREINNSVFGMKYYPDTYKLCISTLNSILDYNSDLNFNDTGSWLIFVSHIDFSKINANLINFVNQSSNTDMQEIKIIPIFGKNNILLSFVMRPFYNFDLVCNVAEQIQTLTGSHLSDNRTVMYFKPGILKDLGIDSKSSRTSYIFRKTIT